MLTLHILHLWSQRFQFKILHVTYLPSCSSELHVQFIAKLTNHWQMSVRVLKCRRQRSAIRVMTLSFRSFQAVLCISQSETLWAWRLLSSGMWRHLFL